MRRLMRWAARLYPAAWRTRYGDELEILLEDAGPRWADLLDIVRGAFIMQMGTVSFWKIAAAFTLAGALVSGAWSLTVPDRYVSSAELRITDGTPTHNDAWRQVQAVRTKVFSRQSLTGLILQQRLYERERARDPLEHIVQNMRAHDLHTVLLNDTQFTVSFANGDPAVAQATVRAVVAALVKANVEVDRSHAVNMEVLAPANLPTTPAEPNRGRMIGRGLLTGMALGILCGALWSIVRGRKQWSLKRVGAFAVAGAAIGIAIAFLTPDQFVSTAVLRTEDADKLELVMRTALSREALAALIQKDGLYPRELAGGRMDQAVDKMRNTAIRVQAVEIHGSTRSLVVSFTYPDRYKAQLVTRDLIALITGAVQVEVLDPPSDPQSPSSPNRPQIAAFGIFSGVLLGLAASRFRRAPLATA